MYSLTINCPSAAALATVAKLLEGGELNVPAKTPAVADKAPKVATQPKAAVAAKAVAETKAEDASEKPVAAAPISKIPFKGNATAATTPAASEYDKLAELTQKLVKSGKRPAALALLAEFGVTKAPDLKPEQYAEYIERAEALLAPAEEELV